MLTKDSFKADKDKFRVICVDTFDYTDWIEGDFNTVDEAIDIANTKGGTMLKTHVYNDNGVHLYSGGNF